MRSTNAAARASVCRIVLQMTPGILYCTAAVHIAVGCCSFALSGVRGCVCVLVSVFWGRAGLHDHKRCTLIVRLSWYLVGTRIAPGTVCEVASTNSKKKWDNNALELGRDVTGVEYISGSSE